MNTNKAWSLNISTAAQWNSGLENLLTSIADNPPASNQNETKGKHVAQETNFQGIMLAGSLRCHHIYRAAMFLSFFFDPTGSGQTNGGRYS